MTRAAAGLTRIWYSRRPTLGAMLLRPLSWLFGGIAAFRRTAYRAGLLRSTRLAVPVIVVGSIVAGGSGKTPLVQALVTALAARGRRPGVLSRGYARRGRDAREAHLRDDPRDVGDEPILLAASGVPVAVGRDRAAAGRTLISAHPDIDVLVTDDGLQHYALARNVEIAVVDAVRGLGNARLLPAGPLREPAWRLDSVDAIVWRAAPGVHPRLRGHAREFVVAYVTEPWINVVDPSLRFDASLLADPESVAVAGIAHPSTFFDGLREAGFAGATKAFADHHAYTRADVAFPHAPAILMTEKDAVKCRAFGDARMWMQPIRARIEPALVDFIVEKIDGPQAPRDARLSGDQGPAGA